MWWSADRPDPVAWSPALSGRTDDDAVSNLRHRRRSRVRRTGYLLRFGLPADAVRPLFAAVARRGPSSGHGPAPTGADDGPVALAVYEPGLSGPRRFLARLGTSRKVTVGFYPRPVSAKGLASVGIGAVAGMMLAQPFDALTFVAPVYGLVLGAAGGAAGWVALRGRRATTIAVDDWRPRLEAISRILQNADRIGQPFASPEALRVALHGALWHAVTAVGQPGDDEVLRAFDEQLTALRRTTDATLIELEAPSIAQRKAAVSERLADAVSEIDLTAPVDFHGIAAGGAEGAPGLV